MCELMSDGGIITMEMYTRMYIAVPRADAEEARALGAVQMSTEMKKKHRYLAGVALKPGTDVWYYVNRDANLFTKWPFITYEVVPAGEDVTDEQVFESHNVNESIEDWFDTTGDLQRQYEDSIPNQTTDGE